MYRLVSETFESLNSEKGTLQNGIRAKVSKLSLDGPVERSLD
jgi:hypothetical protein